MPKEKDEFFTEYNKLGSKVNLTFEQLITWHLTNDDAQYDAKAVAQVVRRIIIFLDRRFGLSNAERYRLVADENYGGEG